MLRLGSATIFNFLTPFSTASGLPALGLSSTSILVTDVLLLEEAEVGEGVADADVLPKASLSFSLVSLSCEGVLDGGVRVPAALRLFLVFTVLPVLVVALAPSVPNTLSLGVTT